MRRVVLSLLSLAAAAPAAAQRPAARAPAAAAERSVPIRDVRYEVRFTRETARERSLDVTMTFTAQAAGPVLLSLPAWTPGAYEITDFAKWVSGFTPSRNGTALAWDKADPDTWRIRTGGAGPIAVRFRFKADTLDNAMSWSREEFALFNGTNVFLYPEGQGFDFPATVTIATEPEWLVATGMTAAGAPRTYREGNYHDLVDMPFFVGRFDYDSATVEGITVRLATYPAGSLAGAARAATWERIRKMWPPMLQVFGDAPFTNYTIMVLADSSYQGASGLEHQNSHVDVITPLAVGNPFLDGLYAHEIIHAWNVKRLRPADLVPYRYDRPQPTTWLWVSEGITDYYADLTLVRAGLVGPDDFYATTAGKIQNVAANPPVALEDASLSTWIHPTDGTGYLYYDKGSLAGLMLDILIRDHSDNRRSLDDVMRALYRTTWKQGRGFTGADFWRAVSAASGVTSWNTFGMRFIDGREPYPWDEMLPLAGLRLVREPRLGVNSAPDTLGVRVVSVAPGGAAAQAGVQPGDYLDRVGEVPVRDVNFGAAFRERYAAQEGAPLEIVVRRGAESLTLRTTVQTAGTRIEADPNASAKAVRIREGILTGSTTR